MALKCVVFEGDIMCNFSTGKACSFVGGQCHPAVEACEGCDSIREIGEYDYCSLYGSPDGKWAYGKCPSASHIKEDTPVAAKKLNPLKASKRGISQG
jgi:hypothetical protein